MSNVINFPGAEAPMDEWVEPIREPITIRIQTPPPPAVSPVVAILQAAVGVMLGFCVVWAVLS